MKTFVRTTIGIGFFVAAVSAFAHGKLVASEPDQGATLERAPTDVRLHFNEPVEATFTTVRLSGPTGTVPTAPATVDKADAKTVTVALPALPAGSYKADWTMVGPDGHKIRGTVAFSVR